MIIFVGLAPINHHGPTYPRQVLERVPHKTPEGLPCRYPKLEGSRGRGGPHIHGRGAISDGLYPFPPWIEDHGMALISTIHIECNGDWRTRMEGCHIPPIRHQICRIDPTLRCMQCHILNMASIRFKQLRFCHVLSQQAK